jgi:hypothetical protein
VDCGMMGIYLQLEHDILFWVPVELVIGYEGVLGVVEPLEHMWGVSWSCN